MKRHLQKKKARLGHCLQQCRMFPLFGILTVVAISFVVITTRIVMVFNSHPRIPSLNLKLLRTRSSPDEVFLSLVSKHVDSESNLVTPTVVETAKNQPNKQTLNNQVKNVPLTPTLIDKYKDAESLKAMAHLFKVKNISCRAIFDKDSQETMKAIQLAGELEKQPTSFTEEFYLNETQNCQHFQKSRGYIMSPLTKEEENFPIAFSLIVFRSMENVERLLRAIYRPQNIYCIHVDKKSPESFYLAVKAMTTCFTNVFLTRKRISVNWGQFSVVEAELMCMRELWSYEKWKYFMNLTGHEFPLKNNWELVKILTAYNGANDIEGNFKSYNAGRWKNKPPPRAIRPVKGSVHITVNRDFVDYILHNETAKELLSWTKTTRIPDETFFATLNHNPQLGIRGTYDGVPETDSSAKPFLTRFKNWDGSGIPCSWMFVRGICVLTSGDLPLLGRERHLFANKFFLDHDNIVIGCLEEKLFNDTRDEYMGVKVFNCSYYANLGFVKSQVY